MRVMESQFFPLPQHYFQIPTHEIPRLKKKKKKKKKHDREDAMMDLQSRRRVHEPTSSQPRARNRRDMDPIRARNRRAMAYGRRQRRGRQDPSDPVRARNRRAMAYGRRQRSIQEAIDEIVEGEMLEEDADIMYRQIHGGIRDGFDSSDSEPDDPPFNPLLRPALADDYNPQPANQPVAPGHAAYHVRQERRRPGRPGIGRRQEHAGPELRGPAGEELRGFGDAGEPPVRQPRERGDRHHDHSGLVMRNDDYPLAFDADDVLDTATARGLYHNFTEHPEREGLPVGPVPDGTRIHVHRPPRRGRQDPSDPVRARNRRAMASGRQQTPLNNVLNVGGAVATGANALAGGVMGIGRGFVNAILEHHGGLGASGNIFGDMDAEPDNGSMTREQRREQEAEYDRLQRDGRLAFPAEVDQDGPIPVFQRDRTFSERFAEGVAAQGGAIDVEEDDMLDVQDGAAAFIPLPLRREPRAGAGVRLHRQIDTGLPHDEHRFAGT